MYGGQQPSIPFGFNSYGLLQPPGPSVATQRPAQQSPKSPKDKKKKQSKLAALTNRLKDALGPLDLTIGAPDWHAPTNAIIEARQEARNLDAQRAHDLMELDALKKQHDKLAQKAEEGQDLTAEDVDFAEHERERYQHLMRQIRENEKKKADLDQQQQLIDEMGRNEAERQKAEKAKIDAWIKQEKLEAMKRAAQTSSFNSYKNLYDTPPYDDLDGEEDDLDGVSQDQLDKMLADSEARRAAERRARANQQPSAHARQRMNGNRSQPFPHPPYNYNHPARDPFASQRNSASSYNTGSGSRSRLSSLDRDREYYHRYGHLPPLRGLDIDGLRRSASASGMRPHHRENKNKQDPDPFGLHQDPYIPKSYYPPNAGHRTRPRSGSDASVPFGTDALPSQFPFPQHYSNRGYPPQQTSFGPSRLIEPMFGEEHAQQEAAQQAALRRAHTQRVQEEAREKAKQAYAASSHHDFNQTASMPRSPQQVSGLGDHELMLLVENAEIRDMVLSKLSRHEQEDLIRRLKGLRSQATPAVDNASPYNLNLPFPKSPLMSGQAYDDKGQAPTQLPPYHNIAHPGHPPQFRTPATVNSDIQQQRDLPSAMPLSPMFSDVDYTDNGDVDDFVVLRKGEEISRKYKFIQHVSQGPIAGNQQMEPVQRVATQIMALNASAQSLGATGVINLETEQQGDGSFHISGDAVLWQ